MNTALQMPTTVVSLNSNLAAKPAQAPMPVPTPTAPIKASTVLSDLKIDQEAEKIFTFISEGSVVKGTLEVPGGARIAGVVTGDLICNNGSAVIEPTGEVLGSVEASLRVIVAGGKVGTPRQGDASAGDHQGIACPNDVIVIGPGVVHGDVHYGNLSTYDAGKITGFIRPFVDR